MKNGVVMMPIIVPTHSPSRPGSSRQPSKEAGHQHCQCDQNDHPDGHLFHPLVVNPLHFKEQATAPRLKTQPLKFRKVVNIS